MPGAGCGGDPLLDAPLRRLASNVVTQGEAGEVFKAWGANVRANTGRIEVEVVLYWSTWEDREFAEERSVRSTLRADGAPHRLRLPVDDSPGWAGTLYQFRLDPAEAACEFPVHRPATISGDR